MDRNRSGCALALVSFVGLGIGWAVLNHAKALDQTMGTQQQQQTQFKQDEDMLGQRLAKAEDTNAQLQGELSVVTDKMKLTQTELSPVRRHRLPRSRRTMPRNSPIFKTT